MSHTKTQPSASDRRRFLKYTWAGVQASLSLALLHGTELFAAPKLGANPFTLGVASGDPTPDGIVLWTRLAPDPANPASLEKQSIPVGWRVAADSRLQQVVASGVAMALPELAHSVHVEVIGLLPHRDYFYQFSMGAEESPVGHFRTAPAAAYQAYYEHMPIRLSVALNPRAGLQIYRRLRYGRLAEFTMLDDRQYRTDNPCGDGESLRCDAARTGNYTMLGLEQEQWVARGFAGSASQWNIVAQHLLIAQLEHATIEADWFWNDAWDGYPLARRRLLSDVVDTKVRNPVFLTGDWHSTFVNDLKLDFQDPLSKTVATEFVTPAISTGGDGTPYGPYYAPMIPYNPHIKYYEGDRRGYFLASVTPKRMMLDLRFVTSVEDPAGFGYTERSWVVEDGVAGAISS